MSTMRVYDVSVSRDAGRDYRLEEDHRFGIGMLSSLKSILKNEVAGPDMITRQRRHPAAKGADPL